MKKALLLCSSHNDLGLVRALRKLGFYIIVTGNKPNLPGQCWCDEFIEADYSDKELILSIAKNYQIDVIIQCCNDFGVYTAAYVAEKLGLPGYDSYENTLILHNKDKFKEFAKQHNIISPITERFTEIDKAKKYAKDAHFPIIIKPTDCSAGNGITKVENLRNLDSAIENAFKASRVGCIVVEPFVTGTQHGFCTFLINKKVVAVCSNNEYSFVNPYRVEIDTYPADNYDVVKEILISEIEKIAKVLDLKDGIFHLQYIFDGEKPQIIEVMRRILGNMYHVPGNLLTGIDWEYWETRARCGLSLDGFPKNVNQEGFYAYKSILSRDNGIVEKIEIPSEYDKYLLNSYYLHGKGYSIDRYGSDPMGFLFFMFPSYTQMKKTLIEDYSDNLVILK